MPEDEKKIFCQGVNKEGKPCSVYRGGTYLNSHKVVHLDNDLRCDYHPKNTLIEDIAEGFIEEVDDIIGIDRGDFIEILFKLNNIYYTTITKKGYSIMRAKDERIATIGHKKIIEALEDLFQKSKIDEISAFDVNKRYLDFILIKDTDKAFNLRTCKVEDAENLIGDSIFTSDFPMLQWTPFEEEYPNREYHEKILIPVINFLATGISDKDDIILSEEGKKMLHLIFYRPLLMPSKYLPFFISEPSTGKDLLMLAYVNAFPDGIIKENPKILEQNGDFTPYLSGITEKYAQIFDDVHNAKKVLATTLFQLTSVGNTSLNKKFQENKNTHIIGKSIMFANRRPDWKFLQDNPEIKERISKPFISNAQTGVGPIGQKEYMKYKNSDDFANYGSKIFFEMVLQQNKDWDIPPESKLFPMSPSYSMDEFYPPRDDNIDKSKI